MFSPLGGVFAVALGGALGSLLRWVLGVRLNAAFPNLPLGTLIANLSAGYVIGLAIAIFGRHTDLPVEWRLFVMTGVLGGLSTFSTFSAEVTVHMQTGRVGWALAEIAVHVVGSILFTFLGVGTVALLRL
jgi:fluoride exporter